jgi:uncharacterized protein with HEPN domain
MRDPKERLEGHPGCDRPDRAVWRPRPGGFRAGRVIQVWIFHHIQIIGEAAGHLGRDFHDAHPEVSWPQIVAMRNVLVHEYFGVDLGEVWKTAEHDLCRI